MNPTRRERAPRSSPRKRKRDRSANRAWETLHLEEPADVAAASTNSLSLSLIHHPRHARLYFVVRFVSFFSLTLSRMHTMHALACSFSPAAQHVYVTRLCAKKRKPARAAAFVLCLGRENCKTLGTISNIHECKEREFTHCVCVFFFGSRILDEESHTARLLSRTMRFSSNHYLSECAREFARCFHFLAVVWRGRAREREFTSTLPLRFSSSFFLPLFPSPSFSLSLLLAWKSRARACALLSRVMQD